MRKTRLLVIPSVIAVLVVSAGTATFAAAPATPARPGASTAVCSTPLGVTTDVDGDRHYRFQFPNGAVEEQVLPSGSFDPAKATAERIKKLALPARPATANADRPQWDAVARGLAHRRTPKPSCLRPGVRATTFTLNYAGYEARAASGKTFSGAHSAYTAPSYYLSQCVDESMAQWVGVSNDSVLIQAGLYADQSQGFLDAAGFIEIVGGSWETAGLLYLANVQYVAGHRYYFAVHYADAGHWSYNVDDLDDPGNSQDGFFPTSSTKGGTQYIQPFGYFVSERLTVNGTMTRYMDHSPVRFRTATVQINGAGDARMSIEQPDEQVMKHGTSRLANTADFDVSTSGFTETFARCGEPD
jgi:hypothetical protein